MKLILRIESDSENFHEVSVNVDRKDLRREPLDFISIYVIPAVSGLMKMGRELPATRKRTRKAKS